MSIRWLGEEQQALHTLFFDRDDNFVTPLSAIGDVAAPAACGNSRLSFFSISRSLLVASVHRLGRNELNLEDRRPLLAGDEKTVMARIVSDPIQD